MHKIEYCDSVRADKKREPTAEEVRHFQSSCCTPTALDSYRLQAEQLLQLFADEIVNEGIQGVEEELRNQQFNTLAEVLKDERNDAMSDYKGALQNVLKEDSADQRDSFKTLMQEQLDNKLPKWWHSVLLSMLAALIFSLIVWAFYTVSQGNPFNPTG